MDYREKLLEKYYNAQTSLEEEKEISRFLSESKSASAENDMFRFFESQIHVPEDIEDQLVEGLETQLRANRRTRRLRWYSLSSTAAVLILLLTVYIDFRHQRKVQLENEFLVMEQALFQVSHSLQPEDQKEMMILWVDEDVEIIIN